MKRHVRRRWFVLTGVLALAAGVAPLLGPGAPTPVAVALSPAADAPRRVSHPAADRVAQRAPNQPSLQPPTGPPNQQQLEPAFTQALGHLRAGHVNRAVSGFEALTRRAPMVPEFHVNLGFALLAEQRLADARKAFERAIDLRPEQANAYYGLAVAEDGLDEPRAAIGAMRTFVHLTPAQQPHVRRARAAIWEWQASLDAAAPLASRSANPTRAP